MSFVYFDYPNIKISNLSDSQEPIYTAERATWATSARITNRTADRIWVSGKLTGDSGEAFFFLRITLEPYESIELPGLPRQLSVGDNLLIFSDDYLQLFDCIVDLQVLNQKNDVI